MFRIVNVWHIIGGIVTVKMDKVNQARKGGRGSLSRQAEQHELQGPETEQLVS